MIIREYIEQAENPFYIVKENGYRPIYDIEFQKNLANYIKNMYGFRDIRDSILYLSEAIPTSISDIIKSYCESIYISKEYEYKKLFNTLSLEYNPIDNYSMEEIESNQNTTEQNGSNKIGEQNTINNYGARNITENNGEQTSINTKKVAPFDSEEFKNNEQENISVNQFTKSSISNSYADNITNGERNDTHTLTETEQNTRTLTRKGNIGVTTSQQMIISEREVANFEFMKIVAKDIVNNISIGVW